MSNSIINAVQKSMVPSTPGQYPLVVSLDERFAFPTLRYLYVLVERKGLNTWQSYCLAQFDAKTAECEATAEARAGDHVTLLQSAYFLNALYAYDQKDWARGWAFAIQTALCTLGMETCPPGQALLAQWWEDTQIAERNLFWRGYALNQQALVEDTRGGLAESKSLFASLALKDIAATAIKEMEELAEAKTPKSIDRVRAELQVRVRASVQAELESGKVGNFYALRIGVIVGLYEAFQLYDKAQAMPDGTQQKAEFAAAALATTAVALDLMHTGAEWTSKKYGAATATGRIAANWGGGLKLYGGYLGAIGSVIGIVLDSGNVRGEFRKGRQLLALAYLVRATASFAVTALTLGVAISGSGPYLRLLMRCTGNPILLSVLKLLEFFAKRLAAEHVLRLMCASLSRLAWAVLTISGIVWLLQPDVVEAWCEKSVFRKDKETKGFKGQAEELIGLEGAFNKTVGN